MAKKKGKQQQKQPDYKREIRDGSFEELLAESLQPVRTVEIGDEVEATVIGFDKDYIFLDLGTRLDGLLRKLELMRDGQLTVKEGDRITVYITSQRQGVWQCSTRSGSGETSEQKARQIASLVALEEAYTRNTPIEGKVTAVAKGGFEIDVKGVKAFCPISQIDTDYCKNPEDHLNKAYTFEIIQFGEEGSNVVVSRREYLKHEAKKKAEKLWEKLEEGDIYEGTITSVQDFGAFINIGGIEGLLHISEISYERIENARDVLKAGQTLEIAIINIDRQTRKVSFSLKSLMEDPWIAAIKKISVGKEVQGKVVKMKTFGAFIELFPGVVGMIHISRLGTDRRHQHPKEVLNIGDVITMRVLEIDEANRKISLTLEKGELDYSKDLKRLKKEQDKTVESSPSPMANLVDEALKKKE